MCHIHGFLTNESNGHPQHDYHPSSTKSDQSVSAVRVPIRLLRARTCLHPSNKARQLLYVREPLREIGFWLFVLILGFCFLQRMDMAAGVLLKL